MDDGSDEAGRTECGGSGGHGFLGDVEIPGSRVVAEPVHEGATQLQGLCDLHGGAGLGLHEGRPVGRTFGQDVGQAAEEGAPLDHGRVAPSGERPVGGDDGGLGIGDGGLGGVADDGGGAGIDDLVGGGGCNLVASDEEVPLLLGVDLHRRSWSVCPGRGA